MSEQVANTAMSGKQGSRPLERVFSLDCSFESGGVWAGFSTFFQELWPEISPRVPNLITTHRHALKNAVPWLLTVTRDELSLTEAVIEPERVRSYAADRAARMPVDISTFIIELKLLLAPSELWVLRCNGLNQISYTGALLITALETSSMQTDANILIVRSDLEISTNPPLFNGALRALTEQVLTDDACLLESLPRAIKGTSDKQSLVKLRHRAVAYFCAKGFYHDAAHYADNLTSDAQVAFPSDRDLQWQVSFKCVNAYLGSGNLEKASALLEVTCPLLATGKSKRMSDLLYLQAMVYARFRTPRDLSKGEELLQQAIDVLDSGEMQLSEFHFARVFLANGIAMIRMFQGRLEDALQITQKGIAELDDHLQASEQRLHRSVLVYNLAQVHARLHNTREALDLMTQAITMDPHYSEYYNDRGSIYLALDKYENAIEDYRRALELSAPYYEVLTNLAQCFRSTYEFEKALEYYERALAHDPSGSLALVGAASCCQEIGNNDQAIGYYTRAINQTPDAWELFANRAAAFYAKDDYVHSLNDINASLALNPNDEQLELNKAAILAASAQSIGM